MKPGERMSFYVWVGVVLAVAMVAAVLGWHAHGGPVDPTGSAAHLSRTTAVVDSAVLGSYAAATMSTSSAKRRRAVS